MPPTPPRAHAPHAQHGKKAGAVRGRARAEKKKGGEWRKKKGGGSTRALSHLAACPCQAFTWTEARVPACPGAGSEKNKGRKKMMSFFLCQRDRSAKEWLSKKKKQPHAGLRSGALLVGVRPPHPPALDGMGKRRAGERL